MVGVISQLTFVDFEMSPIPSSTFVISYMRRFCEDGGAVGSEVIRRGAMRSERRWAIGRHGSSVVGLKSRVGRGSRWERVARRFRTLYSTDLHTKLAGCLVQVDHVVRGVLVGGRGGVGAGFDGCFLAIREVAQLSGLTAGVSDAPCNAAPTNHSRLT